jgi:hypothetical protein
LVELADQPVAEVGLDLVVAGVAGDVRGVDQPTQRSGALGRPDRVRVRLSRISKIPEQVAAAKLVSHAIGEVPGVS